MSAKKGKVQELIEEKFLEERKVFLWGQVDDASAKHVIDRLLYLDLQNNNEIQLVINSPGGYVTSGFAIYDTIKSLKALYLQYVVVWLLLWVPFYCMREPKEGDSCSLMHKS